MPALPSRTSVKLIGGFLAILLLFFWAAVLTMRSLEKVERANAQMVEIAEGVRSGRMVTDILRDQYIQLAQFIISRDWGYVDQFEALSRRIAPLKKRVALQDIWTADEQRILHALLEAHRQFETLFRKDLTEAVWENNIDRVRRIQSQSEGLLHQVVSLNGNLETMFRRKIANARNKQAVLAASAKKSPFIFFGVAVLLSLLIVAYLGHSIADPIRRLIRGTRDIGQGNLTATIQLKRRDEFGQLAESFNRMTRELREHQQRLLQSEKMASLGRMAAGVAHEINNPLAVILGNIRILLAGMAPGDRFYDELKTMEEEARQCHRIVNELRHFSRPTDKMKMESVDVRDIAEEALRAAIGSETRYTVVRDYRPGSHVVMGDRDKLREVLINILQNAADSMPNGGQVRVALQRGSTSDGDQILIEIADAGCGIAEDDLKRIFEPFFTTKQNGMGLGLAISDAIVKAHRGTIRVRSRPREGTTFTIAIPAAQPAGPTDSEKKTESLYEV